MNELRLSEIWIYPVKSLSGIRLQNSIVQSKGLQYDRRWMLIDETNQFITQRENPNMALFKLSLDKEHITIQYKNDSIDLVVNNLKSDKSLRATIWKDGVDVHEVSKQHSRWFSEHMGFPCKLVAFPEMNKRPVDPEFWINDNNVSLADAYPFLIIGQASLDLLNSKLDESLPIRRFRPNFVYTGGSAHMEDTWKVFSIGSNKFMGIKPCSRCVLTTINPDTGEKGLEPLKTLATYRKFNNKILFGQNLVALDQFVLNVGDFIQVESYHDAS